MISVHHYNFCLLFFLCAPLSAGGEFELLKSIEGETMGTTYHIKWADPVGDPADIQNRVNARLLQINKRMSTYDPDSELSQFNRYEKTDWFPVSRETAHVVQAALEMSERSQGAFDPTVGRLVRLWNFGPGPGTQELPSAAEIEEAMSSVGYQLVRVQQNPPALAKTNIAVELDLSAIAKGYGVDAVITMLSEHQIRNTMVEIGGEVRVSGSKLGEPWTLGIQRPEGLPNSLYAKVELQDQALATSGNYQNYFEQDGIRYSHTIDPRTGHPVTHSLASASVIAADCMTADAWATTLMVLGAEKSLELADSHQVSAYLLEHDGETFREVATKAVVGQFVNLTQPPAPDNETISPLLMTFLLSLTVFGVAIIGLAAGVILSNKTLKGTCGGVAGLKDAGGKSICEMCTTPPEECDQVKARLREQIKNSSSQPTA